MRHSKSEIYLHVVWATKGREPLVTPKVERPIHRCIQADAQKLGCRVLALGGPENHMHMVVKMPTTLSAARLANQVKGDSSHLANQVPNDGSWFGWQGGYSAHSVSRSHLKAVIEYVKHQKEHHATGKLWPYLEEIGEDTEDTPDESDP